MGVALIGIIVASCLLTIFTVIIYFVMVHDCGSNNEDDCFPSDIGLEEAYFENMTKIHHEQVCFIVGKFWFLSSYIGWSNIHIVHYGILIQLIY